MTDSDMRKNNARGGPLASYAGARPPAPAWFEWAIAQHPERSSFNHDGLQIELLTWGSVGKPGLLFLHGDSAHADWWSFIAPFFAETHRCAAISWSGMGRSDWRSDGYALVDYAGEAIAAIDAAGLDDGNGVLLIAHSLGGYPALVAGARSERIRGIISVDSAIIPEDLMADVPRPTPRPHRIYQSQTDALARFRFMPPTVGDQHFTIDHIARHGMMEIDGDVEDGRGWRWRFDPEIWRNLDRGDLSVLPRAVRCPVALLVGEYSELIKDEIATYMRGLYAEGTPFIGIPAAGHHVMVDQPLALVAALRACIAYWPNPASGEKI